MAIEIERKFLLKNDSWRQSSPAGTRFCQGYLTETGPGSVRVRIEGDKANINIKGATLGMRRLEFEYEIPLDEAEEMLQKLCLKPLIEKTRYHLKTHNRLWEIDVFEGENEGLCVAEVELEDEDEVIDYPDWVGKEVTSDTRYYNVCLVTHPFKDWR